MLLFLAAACGYAQAPNISYSSPQTFRVDMAITPLVPTSNGVAAPVYGSLDTLGSGFSNVNGVAVDASGNVYVNANGTITKIPAGGGAPVRLESAPGGPTAIDAAGNVYVSEWGVSKDGTTGRVTKIPAGGGARKTLTNGISPTGIAADAAGNVYVGDSDSGVIWKIPAGGGARVNYAPAWTPEGVCIDAAGNVYVALLQPGTVVKIPAGGGTPVTIATGYYHPESIAVDTAGNLYVGDESYNITMIPAGGGGPVILRSGTVTGGLAADAAGNLFITAYFNSFVLELKSKHVGRYYITPALPAGLSFDEATGIISGTPTAVTPAKSYTVTAYNAAGSSSATVNIKVLPSLRDADLSSLQISSGTLMPAFAADSTSYTANELNALTSITVTPTIPYKGMTVKVNGTAVTSGTASANIPLNVGPNTITVVVTALDGITTKTYAITVSRVLFPTLSYSSPQTYAIDAAITTLVPTSSWVGAVGYSNTPISLGSGFSHPSGVAVDAAGNVYMTDSGHNLVKEIPVGGGAPISLGSGLNRPNGITVDAAGNVYVADIGSQTVKKIPVGGGAVVTLASGFYDPFELAVDAAGNLYVADSRHNAVKEIPAGGGAPVILGSGFNRPEGVAVDAAGNVYVADSGNNVVKEIPAGGGPIITLATGFKFNFPNSVAVDAVGNVYVSDFGPSNETQAVSKIPAGGGATVTVYSGLAYPQGIAVDGAGNVYVAQAGRDAIQEIEPTGGYYISALPTGLNFNNATGIISGTPTAVSPAANYTVTAYNINGGISSTVNIKVTLLPNNTSLSGLAISAGTLTPAFAPATISYTATVLNSVTAITLTPTTRNANATVKVNGITVASGTASVEIPLNVGANSISTVVTAQDGTTTKTYTITVTRPPSQNANLAALVISSGTLTPAFTSGTISYTASVPGASFTITPTTSDSTATMTINGTAIVSGSASGSFALKRGANTFAILIRAQDGTTTKTYTITAFRPPFISYTSQQTYTVGTAITPLAPTRDGVGTVGYSHTPVSLGSGFSNPNGVAVDAAGNVYVADSQNNAVKKIPVGGGAPVTLGSPMGYPTDIAVDAAGNVYVCNRDSKITKILAGSGAHISLGSGFVNPVAIAVDAAGNVYVGDQFTKSIKKIPAGGGRPVLVAAYVDATGIAVDAAGNVYVTYANGDDVIKIPADGGSPVGLGHNLAVFRDSPSGVAVDAAGNVYVVRNGWVSPPIFEIPAGGGAQFASSSNFASPQGIAVDAAGNIFVADEANNAVKEVKPVGGYFISQALPAGLSFDQATGIISGTPTTPSPATNYTIRAYNTGGSASATVNIKVGPLNNNANLADLAISSGALTPAFAAGKTSYKASVANTVTSITVTPTTSDADAAVKVNGASATSGTASANLPLAVGDNIITVVVTAQDGTTINTYTITVARCQPLPVLSYSSPSVDTIGVAISPLWPARRGVDAFTYSARVIIDHNTSYLNTPVAVDAAGNGYSTDDDGNILKTPADGSPVVLYSGSPISTPEGIAVDATGNIYETDWYNNKIWKLPVGGAWATIGSGFNHPRAIAVDAAGNVYLVEDDFNTAVKKIPVGGGTIVTLGSGFRYPSGVAVDAAGNVYVTDYAVKKIPVGGGAIVTLKESPGWGIAVDAAGNVYVGDQGNKAVIKIPVDGGSPVTMCSGISHPTNLAVDSAGNIYIVDTGTALKKITQAGGYAINPALPAGLNFDKNTGMISGTPTAVSPATNYTVTAYNGGGSGAATVNIKTVAKGIKLTSLVLADAALSPKFAGDTINYVASVPLGTTSTTVMPTTADAGATITVNGVAVTSGTASAAIPLSAGDNTITTLVTAAGGTPQTTYTVVVTRAPLSNADLSNLRISDAPISPSFATGTTDYTASVPYWMTSVRVVPVASASQATVTVNGTTVASGSMSPALPLAVGENTVSVIVRNGTTAKTYTIIVTRQQSTNTNLTGLALNWKKYALSPSFVYTTTDYTASVNNDVASVYVTPVTFHAGATLTVNSIAVNSGSAIPIALTVGPNVISTTVTAPDGVSTKTYTIIVTRQAPESIQALYQAISVKQPADNLENDGIKIPQGISPNGDGINDYLVIDGIANYPDNKLLIMNRGGTLVFEAKGYDNSTRVFDGHSNKNGIKQLPGTYFYSLDYNVKGITRRKTGFIVLKY